MFIPTQDHLNKQMLNDDAPDDELQAFRKGGKVYVKNKNKNVNKNNINVIIHNHHKTARRKKSLSQQTQKLKQQATPRPFQPIVGYVGNPSPSNFNLNELMQKLEALKEQQKVPESQAVRPEILPSIIEEPEFGFHDAPVASISLSPEAGAGTQKAPTENKQVATLLIEQGLHGLLNGNNSINTQKFNEWYDKHKDAFDNGKYSASTSNTKYRRVLDRIDYVRGMNQAASAASAHDDEEVVGTVSKKKSVKKLAFGGSV